MENDIEQARASNMENDIEQPRASDIEMAINIVEKLDILISTEQNSSESRRSECCIYRVPQSLRKVNWEVYAPQLISIGPLHRNNEKLQAMEKEKLEYFKKLTERNGMDKKKRCDIVIGIKNQEKRLRHCYSEKFKKIKSDDFVEMILLDAVFIIQFFLESNDDTDGPKSFEPRTLDIREDLMLLENQLPLFIIEKIYDRVSYHYPLLRRYKPKSFLDLATCYLREYLHLQVVETSSGVEVETSSGVKRSEHITDLLRKLMFCKTSSSVKKETSPDVKKEARHLTDLLRNLMLSRAIQRTYPHPVKLKYSAIMLHKAGVRFQATQDKCLVNITFDKGVLKIPQLEVDRHFERLVRNIMALEQCCYPSEAYICSYIKFMDHLIDSAEDVGLLVEKRIIVHWLGDDAAVSNMINNFCENIGDIKCTYFGHISQGLNDHFQRPYNNAIATLALVYFRSKWRGTGTISGAIMLILTLIQTIKAFS